MADTLEKMKMESPDATDRTTKYELAKPRRIC